MYFYSDYGFGNVDKELISKIVSTKPKEAKDKTAEQLKNLPDTITIYRGGSVDVSVPASEGFSWSLDINVANFFASRRGTSEAYIAVGKIHKDKVIECDIEGTEQEIIVSPEDVEIVKAIDINGLSFCHEVLNAMSEMYLQYKNKLRDIEFYQDSKIHGVGHELRVLLLCLTIGYCLGLSDADLKILATAAIYHDTRRIDDDVDVEHGKNAKDYYEAVTTKPNPLVSFICEYHNRPDEEAYSHIKNDRTLSKKRRRAKLLFDVFKDADALDRVRFDIMDLDLNQLRVEVSKSLTLVARIYLEQIKA